MSTENSSSTSRIARSLTPRRVLPVALLFLIADLALTEALLGLAVEKNPIAAWLFEAVGVTTTGIVAVGVVTLAYVGLDALDQFERERLAVSGGLLGAMIAPVVWNLGVWVRLDTPSVALGAIVNTLAPVSVAAGIALVTVFVDLERVPRPDRGDVASIALSVLMVTSMIGGVAFIGTQPAEISSQNTGTVSSQSTYEGEFTENATVIDDMSDTDAWGSSGFWPYKLSTTNETSILGDTAGVTVDDNSNEDVSAERNIDSTDLESISYYVRKEGGGFYPHFRDSGGATVLTVGIKQSNYASGYDGNKSHYIELRRENKDWVNTGIYVNDSQWLEFDVNFVDGVVTVYDRSGTSLGQYNSSWNVQPDVSTVEAVTSGGTTYMDAFVKNGRYLPPDTGSATPFSGWEDTAPLIRAVDQNGDPVPDAEIEAWSVQSENLEAEAENKSERAEEILDQLEDVQPGEWTPPTQADLTYGDLTDLYEGEQPDGVYPTAHTKGDMGIAGWADTHDLIPRLEFESGETIYLYAWDGGAGANMGPTDDGVTSEHYGEIADNPKFTLKRLSANGEVLDNHTVSSTQSETYSGGIPPLSYDHDYATANVPDGYYLVTVQGSDTPGYVIKVGQATDVLTTELRNEANQLTEQSEFLQDYLEGDSLARDNVIANKKLYKFDHTDSGPPVDTSKFDYGDGYVNPGLSPSGTDPTDMETNRVENFPSVAGTEIFLQGYKGPGFGVGDYGTNNTTDILEMAQDVDEPIYVSKKPKRVDMSEIDDPRNTTIEVELTKLDSGLNPNVSEYANKTERLRNELLNQSTAELESLFRDNPELLNRTDLVTRHEELDELIESNNDLEERVAELRETEDVENASDATEEQLRNDLAAMEQAIAELEGQLEAEDPTSEIENGEIFAEFPFAESLNPDAVTVIANYEDGSSEVVPDEYISVESASVLGGDQVVVEGYNISNDRAVADLEVKGVSTEGALGSSRDTVTNPAFQGAIPELDAIDVSTLRPGVGDSVSVEPRSSAEGYGGAESATVYGPDGDTLNVTQNDERFTWSPEQPGTHTVRVTYSNDIGGQFTETFRLKAEDNPASNPPTARITDGIGGNLLLAGSGLESGSISVDGAEAEVVAQAPGDQSPSSLDIRAQQLAVDSMDVSVVQGSDQRSVDRHVSLRVWANFGVENALVLRQSGEPITANEETPYGAFQTRTSESGAEHQVVETYTEADGTTTVQVKRNPSLLDRASYQIAIWGIDLPFTYLPTTPPEQLPLTMLHPPAVDEATPGEVVFGPADMTAVPTGVGA